MEKNIGRAEKLRRGLYRKKNKKKKKEGKTDRFLPLSPALKRFIYSVK